MESIRSYSLPTFSNFDTFAQADQVDEETTQQNQEQCETEVESLQSILNEQECQVLQPSQYIQIDGEKYLDSLCSLTKFSVIPGFNNKFIMIDKPKDIRVELRCLPALELVVALPKQYPSHHKPLILLDSEFYAPFKEFLYEQLNAKWSEEQLMLYEHYCYL